MSGNGSGIPGERRPQEWLDWECPMFDTLGAVSILTWTLPSTLVEPAVLLFGISVVFGWNLDQDTDYRDRDFYGCPQALHTDMSILEACILTLLKHRRHAVCFFHSTCSRDHCHEVVLVLNHRNNIDITITVEDRILLILLVVTLSYCRLAIVHNETLFH